MLFWKIKNLLIEQINSLTTQWTSATTYVHLDQYYFENVAGMTIMEWRQAVRVDH